VHREVLDKVVHAPEDGKLIPMAGPHFEKALVGEFRQAGIDLAHGRPKIVQELLGRNGLAPVELFLANPSDRLPADHLDGPVAAAFGQVQEQIANAVRGLVAPGPDLPLRELTDAALDLRHIVLGQERA